MTSKKTIEEKLEKLAQAISTDETLIENVMSRIDAKPVADSSIGPAQNIWRTIMKSPITKLAAAAVIIIACVIAFFLWRSTGSGIALADVLARLEQVKAVKYKTTFKVFGSDDPNELWSYSHHAYLISKEYGEVMTYNRHNPNGGEITESVSYSYPHQKRPEIKIDYISKTYEREETDGQDQDEPSERQEDSIYSLKDILHTEHESIGRSVIDGIEVEGFKMTANPDYSYTNYRYKGPRFLHGTDVEYETTLWVDVKTLLPVRIEYLTSDIDDPDENTRVFLQQVDDNFKWDITVDASEFEAPPIQEGYAIQDMFPELTNEENAIGGFKQCVELFGNYPERIDLTYLWAESEKGETIAALRLKEELKGFAGLERDNKKMDALKPIRFLNKLYAELVKKDSVYYGKTVTPRDTDKVLLRWKLDDDKYRVIFGDLNAETVTAEVMKELEMELQ